LRKKIPKTENGGKRKRLFIVRRKTLTNDRQTPKFHLRKSQKNKEPKGGNLGTRASSAGRPGGGDHGLCSKKEVLVESSKELSKKVRQQRGYVQPERKGGPMQIEKTHMRISEDYRGKEHQKDGRKPKGEPGVLFPGSPIGKTTLSVYPTKVSGEREKGEIRQNTYPRDLDRVDGTEKRSLNGGLEKKIRRNWPLRRTVTGREGRFEDDVVC